MGTCNIDHSLEDVKQKLADQKAFLPADLNNRLKAGLTADLAQESLNEIFHLLKKYDLASETEQKERNEKLAVYA